MFCSKCGKEIDDNVRSCNYCGAKNGSDNNINSQSEIDENNTHIDSEQQSNTSTLNNNQEEKTYCFESSKGLFFPSFQRIKTAVTLLDDRLVIEKIHQD